MGIFDFWKKKEDVVVENDGFFKVSEQVEVGVDDKSNFKSEIEKKEVKFPVELGEEHPFDFRIVEGMYRKMGFVAGVIDKYVDFVVGPGFFVESSEERAKEIIEGFMRDVNFDTLLRAWIKEALVKGNGFIEIGGGKDETPQGLKVLNANWMYVKRDDKGVIEGYNQYVGGFKKFDRTRVIPFEPFQVAHIGFNKIGDDAYGQGVISPALVDLNYLLQNEKNLHMLMDRKANAPYDVSMGKVVGGKYIKPSQASIEGMGKKLEWLHNKHEWVHDGLTDIKVLDFGNFGDKFEKVLEHDLQKLFYTFQVPAVIMGQANVPEGLAKVQMDAFERRISSIQAEVEKVIENDIFKRVLKANGFDVHVEFQWGRPSNMERMERLDKITNLIKTPSLSTSLLRLVEREVVKLMGLNEEEFDALSEEEERGREEERPLPLVPGQNATPPQPGQNKLPQQPVQQKVHKHIEEDLDKYNNIEEWLGFNYKEYLDEIENVIKLEVFENLAAKTNIEEIAGLLSSTQIKRLKEVMNEGFNRGLSIREIARNIERRVKPKDLLKMKGGVILKDTTGLPLISRKKELRGIAIARSETTRLANEGAIKHFESKGISKIRWVASFGSRTCPECEALNGQVFNIVNHPPIPLHSMCRCTVVAVSEVG